MNVCNGASKRRHPEYDPEPEPEPVPEPEPDLDPSPGHVPDSTYR